MKPNLRLLSLLAAAASAVQPLAHAQAPVPASGNLVENGDFTKVNTGDNLWDGVNEQGTLAGYRRACYAVTEAGPPGDIDLPISVNCVDMNGDSLLDIVTADTAGFMRVYFNSGTKTEPKFTVGEVVPIFLSRPSKDEEFDEWWGHGQAKIHMVDWNKNGSLDLMFGNYGGELLVVPNGGSNTAPAFPQPPSYIKATIPTSQKAQLWANLLAPCVVDLDKDGKTDILVGEGSYSANAIHFLKNAGAGSEGKFSDEGRYYLVYGEGREHLVPTAADMNGDGVLDILVGDRVGTVSLHLGKADWKPGDVLPLTKMLDFGGSEKIAGPARQTGVSPFAVDLNGDGLTDILMGKADGRIQLAINKGTAQEPKFDKPQDVKGTDLWKKNVNVPPYQWGQDNTWTGWTVDPGTIRGNIYGYCSVTQEQSPGGGRVMKMGYWPTPNKIFKLTHPLVSGRNTPDFFRFWAEKWQPMRAERGGEYKPVNYFNIRQQLTNLKNNATYTLTFKTRGKRLSEGMATIAMLGVHELAPTQFQRKARGVNFVRNEEKDEQLVEAAFTANSAWTTVTKTFTVSFKGREIKKLPAPTLAVIEFKAMLAPYDGECEIADVTLVEKK